MPGIFLQARCFKYAHKLRFIIVFGTQIMSDDENHSERSDNLSNQSEGEFDVSLNSSLEHLDMIGEAKSEDEKEEEMQFPIKKVQFLEDPVDKEDDDDKEEAEDGNDGYEEFEDVGERPFEYNPVIPRQMEKKQRSGVELKGEDRLSSPLLNRYEYCHIVSLRALQLEKGAPLYMEAPEIPPGKLGISSINVAEMELRRKKTPVKLRRVHSNNDFEFWSIDELTLDIFYSKTNLEHFKDERRSIYNPPPYFCE